MGVCVCVGGGEGRAGEGRGGVSWPPTTYESEDHSMIWP